ncbi:MAG: zinc-binding alcohol dehydrogenase family protein [Prochlorococcaceae cyanobacterium]|jgi:NADPH2:quinone reductase
MAGSTMQAITTLPGLPLEHPDSFRLVALPRPEPGPRDLRVRVEAVGVNPIDTKLRQGEPERDATGRPLARVLGWDAAGTVEAVGAEVRQFRVGDGVMFAGDVSRPGCCAEAVLVDERIVGPVPAGLSMAKAAALPLPGLTAWEALFEQLGLDPHGGDAGRRLLVINGAGGVGSLAIPLARQAGLEVIATASRPGSRTWALQHGASHVIDHSQPLAPQLEALGIPAVEAILNAHGTETHWEAMARLIRPRGGIVALVSSRTPLDLNLLKAKSVRFSWEFVFTRPQYGTDDRAEQGRILRALAERVESGALSSPLRTCLAPIGPDSLRQAHALLEEGHNIGRLVLRGWPD